MKAIGIGLGSIGQRHFKNLYENFDVDLIAYRRRCLPTQFIDDKIFKTYTNLEKAIAEKPDIALITNPTSMHIPIATKLADNGCHLFIEKPLSHDMNGIGKLIDIVEKKKLITFIGCNLRFHPCIKTVKQLIHDDAIGDIYSTRAVFGTYMPEWHPWEDYRDTYPARKSLGGGVILTSIHELDYLYWMFGNVDKLIAYTEKDSKLEIDTEDNAEIIMKFKNGIVANVHLDFYSKPYRRGCKVVGENGTIVWDFDNNKVSLYEDSTNRWKDVVYSVPSDYNQVYIDEMKHFIDCVNNNKETINNIYNGKNVLELALAAKKSSEERRWIKI